MNDLRISNSIYISTATLESIVILILRANSSTAYYYGMIWIFPIFLVSIPIYRLLKKEFLKNDG